MIGKTQPTAVQGLENAPRVRRRWLVNGVSMEVETPPGRRLLDVLREDLGLTGTKEGCGEGECGACSVLLDDRLVLSCLLPAGQAADGARIDTVEGLERTALGRALQEAFVEKGAAQCGFCIPGMLMAAYALLAANPDPDDAAVREGLSGNLCRCTGYVKIVEAVRAAADRMRVKP